MIQQCTFKKFSEKNHLLGNSITTLLLSINIVNCSAGEKQTVSRVRSPPVTKVQENTLESNHQNRLRPKCSASVASMSCTLLVRVCQGSQSGKTFLKKTTKADYK